MMEVIEGDAVELENIHVHTEEFILDPNSVITRDGKRLSVGRGTSGPEFLTYKAVEELFKSPHIRPKTAQVYLDMGVTKDSPIYVFLQNGNFNMMPIPDHARMRKLMMRGFRPSTIRKFELQIRDIVDDLLSPLKAKGQFDVVGDFTHFVSIRSISRFIGVPDSDVHHFSDATTELVLLGTVPFKPVIPRLENALREIFTYIEKTLIPYRKSHPQEDFISDLMSATTSGEMTEAELIWGIVFLLLAGHDSTRFQMATTIRCIIQSGNWETLAADPSRIPAAIKEAHRMFPAAYRFPRLVLDTFEYEGLKFREGDLLSLNLAAAGRDPERFADPDRFDLERGGSGFDIRFGYGAHHCLGWGLTTAEMTEAVRVLTSQLTDVRIEGEVEYLVGGVLAGPDKVDISFRERG